LLKNFRSHQNILKFPNERFYNNDLQECGDRATIDQYLRWSHLPKRGFPIIFHAIHGKDDREASSPSFFNIDEISEVREYVKKLRLERDRTMRISTSSTFRSLHSGDS
jgi:helicase MOV-10